MLILNHLQIQQRLKRMAFQIYEDNYEAKEIVLAGIAERGYVLATMLKKEIEQISAIKVLLVKITIQKHTQNLAAELDTDISLCEGKSIIIADDVLHTGRTLAYGLGMFYNIATLKIRTAILVNRSHKKYPIATDFVGIELSTILEEHISVSLSDTFSVTLS